LFYQRTCGRAAAGLGVGHREPGEVAVDFLLGHPEIERAGRLRVPADRFLLEGALVLAGPRPQLAAELAYLQLPQLLRGNLRGG
jgi:hypothetical protein